VFCKILTLWSCVSGSSSGGPKCKEGNTRVQGWEGERSKRWFSLAKKNEKRPKRGERD